MEITKLTYSLIVTLIEEPFINNFVISHYAII